MAFLNETGLTTLWAKIKSTFVLKTDYATTTATLSSHVANKSNPHGVTASQVGAYTKSETDTAISKAVSSAYKIMGSVDDYSDLPTDAAVGDVYNIVNAWTNDDGVQMPEGMNVVWVGATGSGDTAVAAHWDALGGAVDLSVYYTKDEVDSKITASKVTVDSALSSTSTNPVQNK